MKFNQQFSSKFRILSKGRVVLAISVIAANILHASPEVNALPTNPSIVSGNININAPSSNTLNINQASNKGIINWGSFNIGSAATVNFKQPNVNSSTLNRVVGGGLSQIAGNLNANGNVILINPNGVVFQNGSRVDVGSITASTMNLKDKDFLNDKLNFTRDGNIGKVINKGTITAKDKGYVALLAPEVQNDGVIKAVKGSVAFASGDAITLDLDGDGLLNVEVEAATIDTLIENKALVQADGGLVYMSSKAATDAYASTVSNSGKVSASSMDSVGGKIVFLGSDITNSGTLEAKGKTGGGEILVGGDWQGANSEIYHEATTVTATKDSIIDASAVENGDGGKVVLWSDIKDKNSITSVKGTINAKGGEVSGDGGEIETSGKDIQINDLKVSTQATNGKTGNWLIDPDKIYIRDRGTDSIAGTTIDADTVVDALSTNNITLTAVNEFWVEESIDSPSANSLTLKSEKYIVLNANVDITTDGGDIILWSNTTNTSSGTTNNEISFAGLNTLTSNGGDIILAGGLDSNNDYIPDGYAYRGGYDGAAVSIGANTSLLSDGGNIVIKGQSGTSEQTGNNGIISGAGLKIDAGLGIIEIDGISGNSSTGVELSNGTADTVVTSSSTLSSAISITGESTSGGIGVRLGNAGDASTDILIQASGIGGGISITGTSNSSHGYFGMTDGTLQILAQSGDIVLKGVNTAGGTSASNADFKHGFGSNASTFYLGNRKDATSINGVTPIVTTSSSDITMQGDFLSWDDDEPVINTTGAFTVESVSNSFSTSQNISTSWFTFTNIGDLTIGKSTNVQNVTVNEALNASGNINLFGKDITISENLDTSGVSGGDILLKATGNIIQNDSKSIVSNGGDIILWANSDNLNGGYVLTGQNVTLDSRQGGASTGGGHIHIGGGADTNNDGFPDDATAANANSSGGTAYGILFGNAAGSGVQLLSGGGNITLIGGVDGNFNAAANSHGIGFYPGYTINSGAGNITFNGYANSGGATTIGIDLMTFGATNASSITTTGDLTLNGVTTVTTNTNLGILLNNGITIDAGTVNITGNSEETGLILNGSIRSDGSMTLRANSYSFNSANVLGQGTLTIEPLIDSNSFSETFNTINLTLGSGLSELIIGKPTNTADVTIASNTNISGPITAYGGNITVNGDLITSSGSGGDILLKASDNITLNASKSITTDGGTLTLWSNSDSNGGYIYIQDNVNIDTRTASDRTANNGSSDDENGGAIVLGGGAGTSTPTGYAHNSETSFRGGINLGTESAGSRHDSGISFISGGGDISLKGQQSSTSNGDAAGINAYEGFVLDGGKTGSITLVGDVSGSSASFSDGMNLGNFATTAGGTASYIKTVNGDITLTGTSGSGSTQSRGVLLAGGGAGIFVQSTGTGDITISGTPGGGAGTPYNILLIGANVLANSGSIELVGGSTGTIYSSSFASTIGYKSGSDITSSSSDITVTADKFDLTSGIGFNTSGTLTIRPTAGNSFTSAFDTSSLTYSSDVSGLTIGHSSNTGDITVGSSTTIAGDISLYGGDITVSGNLDTSSVSGGNILLKASDNITVASGKNITTDEADVLFWSDSDNNDLGYIDLSSSGQTISTNGGDIVMAGGSGTTMPTGFANGGTSKSGITLGTGSAYSTILDTRKTGTTAGNIIISGKTSGSFDGIYTANAQFFSDDLTISGETSNASNYGLRLGSSNIYNGSNVSQILDVDNDLTITAVNTASNYSGNAMRTGANPRIYADGNITINSSGKLAYTSYQDYLNINPNKTLTVNFDGTANFTTSLGNTDTNESQGSVVIQSYLQDSFTEAFDTSVWNFLPNLSGLTIGKTTNIEDITIGSDTTIAGDIDIFGKDIIINDILKATNSTITLDGSGTVSDGTSGYVVATNLALLDGAVTLNHASNNIDTIAASGINSLTYADSNALEIDVVNPTGITSTGAVDISTLTGDLTVNENISATSVTLNAGHSITAGTSTGGNIIIGTTSTSTTPTVTASTGNTKLYTGSISGSTGVTTLVGSGNGNFRYNSDETITNFTNTLGSTGTYAIYREQPSVSGTISSETITYGDTTPSFTMSGSNGLVNGDSSSGFTIVGSSNSTAGKLEADEYDVSASGLSALGYSVSSVTNGKLTVNKKSLSVAGLTASSKTYNADNTAILSNAGTLNGKVTGDTVTFTTSSTFNNANVEATKTLNLDFTLGGTDKDNYSLSDASDVTTSALINAKELTLSANKTYDGTTSLTGDITLAGYVGSETLTYSNASANDSHVATADKYINAITLEDATDSSGGIATNYKLPTLNNTNAPVTINAVTLTPTISNTSVTKTYDATTNASSGFTPTYNFVGLISGDTDVNLSYTSANYDDKDVSNASKITLAGLSINNITGTNSSNASDYILDSTSKDVSASITKANLTVSANDDAKFVTQSDTSEFAGVTYSGFVGGEDVTDITTSSLTISRTDAITDTTAGIYTDKLVASGLSSDNYSFTYENGDYTIVPSDQLLVKVTNVNNNYGTATQYAISSVEYANGSTVYRLDNGSITNSSTSINANNEVTITDGSGGSATFTVAPQNQSTSTAGKLEVGSYQLGIDGIVTENSENFGDTLTLIGSHQVNKKSLTASANGGINKIYDGTTAMNGVSLSLSTLESNSGTDDIVTASGVGAFTNKNVSTTAGYTISNVALSGTDSSNYYLSAGTSFSGSDGVISVKELILDYTAANKVYDGDTIASVSSTDNIISGDDVVISQTANFSDKNVANDKTVSIVTSLSGSDKDNYVLSTPNISKTANITRLNSVTWIGGTSGNWFDPANWAGGAVPDLSNVSNVVIPDGTTVSFDTSGAVSPADTSSAVNIDSLGTLGSLTMANGELNIQNSMTLDTFTQNGGILTAGSITTNTLSQSAGTTTTDNLTVNESFTQSGTTGQITVNNNANITQINGNMQIGNLDVGGDLTANANNGNIVQVNGTTIDVSGLTTLNASEDITLDSITNNFTTLALNAVNATIVDGVGGIILDDITTTGNLDITSLGGDITQNENSSIKARGTSSFDSGSNDIILGNNTNEFGGNVNLKGNSATIGGKTRPTIGSQNLRNGLIITNKITAFVKKPELKPINQKPINPNADAPVDSTNVVDTGVNDNIEVDASATNNATNNAQSNELSTQASTANTQDTNVVEQNNTKMSFDGIVVGSTQTGSDVKAIVVQGSSSSNTPVTMLVKVKAQEGLNFTVPKSIVSQVTKTAQAPAKVIGATLSDGKELPSWLSFDITTSSFTSANVPSNGLPLSVKVMTSNGKSIEVVLNK